MNVCLGGKQMMCWGLDPILDDRTVLGKGRDNVTLHLESVEGPCLRGGAFAVLEWRNVVSHGQRLSRWNGLVDTGE